MPLASEVASELRKLADSLDRNPNAEIERGWMDFYCRNEKEHFLALAKSLPRPYEKTYENTELRLRYDHPALRVDVHVDRDKVCTIVKPAEPAVYECLPLLSDEELASVSSPASPSAEMEVADATH